MVGVLSILTIAAAIYLSAPLILVLSAGNPSVVVNKYFNSGADGLGAGAAALAKTTFCPDVNSADISATGHPGKWQPEGFITALRTGKTPEGKQLSDAMPWKFLTFTDDELKAIHLYLQQQN